jgi:hypothetical protein
MNTIPRSTAPLAEMKNFLVKMGVTHTFRSKKEYNERLDKFRGVYTFPWRQDQLNMINTFLEQQKKYTVTQGVPGSGKTTAILACHTQAVVKGIYRPDEAMFLSFNVCIKNELIQKLRGYGMSSKSEVRTFDSVIYEICKKYDYPYLNLPNFEGKRKFVYKICDEIKAGEKPLHALSMSPRVIYVDEVQDLESQTLCVFQTFFPEANIIYTGDIFQSIQKEPRESLLWYLLNTYKGDDISRIYMTETPRVPHKMLENVKDSLKTYYPEFNGEIDQWHSSSTDTTSEIEWHRFYNYSELYKRMDEFVESHPPERSMILTFSSAITVKGAMGDLARIRRYLANKGIDVNHNHKKMDHDKLFLSTVNSSKGLERDYVFVVSTFPLERAFVNFSKDLVVNLITVGVTRSKQKVVFYVPAYDDKFSKTLENFAACPRPNQAKIREGKVVDEFTFDDYLHIEHSVTELIKQSIIKYDTRIRLKEFAKKYDTTFLFDQRIPAPKISTEEERSFVGVLLENLITSSWSKQWPEIDDIEMLRNHPMYTHCFKKIEDRYKAYHAYIKQNTLNDATQFKGIYYYSQIHVAMYNKLFMDFREASQNYFSTYWSSIKDRMVGIQPTEGRRTIQTNMRMPWVTGIADVVITEAKKDGKDGDVTIWELKASTEADWADDALTQAMLYGLMTGKTRARLVLLNPFRNEKLTYYFNMKRMMEMRNWVLDDVMSWNVNCYLTKQLKARGKALEMTNQLFLMRNRQQCTLFQFLSPTKLDIVTNVFMKTPCDTRRKDMTMLQKLCHEAETDEETCVENLRRLLETPSFRDKKVYYTGLGEGLDLTERFISVDAVTGDMDLLDEMGLKAEKGQVVHVDERPMTEKKRRFQADYANTFIYALTMCGYLAREYKFM